MIKLTDYLEFNIDINVKVSYGTANEESRKVHRRLVEEHD